MRYFVHAALTLFATGPLLAQTGADAPTSEQGDLSVTIYNNNMALIQDRRDLMLPAHRSRVEFPDVSAQIRAETVNLSGPGISIIEQNFDYDLLTPAKLMEKAVGQTITLLRTNPATGAENRVRAKVLAANGGVVLQIGDQIEVLRDDGLPVRVIFDSLPPNLRARPTLSVTVEAKGGKTPATLTYLTPGLGWSSDYVALYDEARQSIDVQGWVTLTNNSGTDYTAANVLLVSGQPNNGENSRSSRNRNRQNDAGSRLDIAGTESSDRERLGDYYLYPLPERTTIANAQQKQVGFLDVKNTPARRAYEYQFEGFADLPPTNVWSVIKFSTSRAGGLGDLLPQGTIRVYMHDKNNDPQFIGESKIDAAPLGSSMSVRTGQAFDVKIKTVVLESTKVSQNRWRTKVRYELTNARNDAVTVDLAQSNIYGNVNIIEQSQESKRVSASRVEWQVAVPANGTSVLTATFERRN